MNYAELLDHLESIDGLINLDSIPVKVIVDGEIFDCKKLTDLNGEYFLDCYDEE